MLNFSLLIFEIIIIAVMILFMHGMRKQIGYGVLISNIAITLFSHFLLIHSETDVKSSSIFLEELLNFELTLFLTGTSLLYIEGMMIVVLFQIFDLKLPKFPLFLKIYLTMAAICLFDSVIFYTFFYLKDDNYEELMLGNIVGKQITVIIMSSLLYFYLVHIAQIKSKKPKTIRETLKVFTF